MSTCASSAPSARGAPSYLREAIRALARAPEPELVAGLLAQARNDPQTHQHIQTLALTLARGLRVASSGQAGLWGAASRSGLVQGLLQEFSLSSQEGVALMCLAEALLRIPDDATRDALIKDKIAKGNWRPHAGQSPSLFVNAAAWGLVLTGQLVATHSAGHLGAALKALIARGGEPLIRKGVDLAMRLMGEQFVTGQTIEQALRRAQQREALGFRYSFDMLGESAMTDDDAQAYWTSYSHAIDAIGQASAGRGPIAGPGISIKLSAVHPRYSRLQSRRVHEELYPRLLSLAQQARQFNIGLNIDAEEADRLDLSLDLMDRLCFEPSLAGWQGLGFVVQAYGKRCPAVIDWLIDVAQRSQRRLMVRLVKGAYWDSEIKRAQLDGLAGYPVYTRKAYTDLAYLACAKKLLSAPHAVFAQFATHNAHTLAAVHEMAGGLQAAADAYEFQCLHGMGETLYEQVVGPPSAGGLGRPCRIYAPVGTHETLLAYLVRRLLENGANTSFVHRVADHRVALDALVQDPVKTVETLAAEEGELGRPHPAIALPVNVYGPARQNSRGWDFSDEATLGRIERAVCTSPELACAPPMAGAQAIRNPACVGEIVGQVAQVETTHVPQAVLRAQGALDDATGWSHRSASDRAQCLLRAAQLIEDRSDDFLRLLVQEAGKTAANAVSELREAVDFLRYDAWQLQAGWDTRTHRPLGPVVCISPWNFPLAIFVGQIAAALAAGNTVLAKPAEQTPLTALAAAQALWDAGVPMQALQVLPGPGDTVGAALVADPHVQAVLFTGSTEVARLLQRRLAQRLDARGQPVTLIAETGGQNAMVVDSSALAEQVVQDVVTSAFDSAGQRCSALRVLCVQEEVADRFLRMLEGAMRELRVGDPRQLWVDIGPVIDEPARQRIEQHIQSLAAQGMRVRRPTPCDPELAQQGHYVAPTVIEIDRVQLLHQEVFGPVLHVIRYTREALPSLLQSLRDTGYGLTQGVHSRIDETIAQIVNSSRAGNVYVNRNMVGAVVGLQPFGGEGLSGTGPKAGGPLYMLRLLSNCPADAGLRAIEAASSLQAAPPVSTALVLPSTTRPREAFVQWCHDTGRLDVAQAYAALLARMPGGSWRHLLGPTGEANLYSVRGREYIFCAGDADARIWQLAAVLAVGGHAVWHPQDRPLFAQLPPDLQGCVRLGDPLGDPNLSIELAMYQGPIATLQALRLALSQRPGPLVGVIAHGSQLEGLRIEQMWVERSLSINTAAAGGNASLMSLE